jgi:hypothetical protein
LGDGDIALVFVPGYVSNVDLYDDPRPGGYTAVIARPSPMS